MKRPRASSSAKTFSFALLHFSVAFSVAYLLTGDVLIGGALALVEPAVNTVAFHFHALAWRRMESRTASGISDAERHARTALPA